MCRITGTAGNHPELEQVLREVTESFVKRFELQIELLDAFSERVCELGPKPDAEEVNREAHKLSGIARTLGFSRLGDAAAKLEEVTDRETWVRIGRDQSRVLSCVDNLIAEMEAAQRQVFGAKGRDEQC